MNSTDSGLSLYLNSLELSTITSYTELLLLPRDLAINLEIDFFMLKNAMLDEDGPIYKAFQTGIMLHEKTLNDKLATDEIDGEEYIRRKEILTDYKLKSLVQLSL